jgi:alkylation response protein AidB-like acyl-CoA dehydrogenase
MMAIDACAADRVLVAIDADTLAVVRGDATGLEITRLETVDATRCTAEVVLDGVAPEAVFEGAGEAIARMLDAGRIALAADAHGACEAMVEQAVAYAKERKQFDRVIGSFQAVKHMCSEMIAEVEPARSLLWYAAHSFDAIPDEAPLMACHTLSHTSEIAREIASVSTQVHGGIGWTDEQNLHFWFKRIANARHLLGGPEYLRNRAAELQGFAVAS